MARDAHTVDYLCSDFYQIKGAVEARAGDPPNLRIKCLSLGARHAKYRFLKRAVQELRYGLMLSSCIADTAPDAFLSCNTPLIASHVAARRCRRMGVRYVHWAQDIHSVAIASLLGGRVVLLGRLLSGACLRLERGIIQHSYACVVISKDHVGELERLHIRPQRLSIIPNWMPLDEMTPTAKANDWSRRYGLAETVNLMYVGTLSLKHSARPFVDLALHFRRHAGVRIVVVAAGVAFDALVEERERFGLDNLVLLGWQRYDELPMVMGTGDVLFATVSADGSRFSVPCKVLSYASAGRPVLAHMPADNLARRIVEENRFGLGADPQDTAGLLRSAEALLLDSGFQAECGQRARAYAEANFSVARKAEEFYRILGATKLPPG
jgi:glycosyltransferase involved in cell wall biosynthesis